MDETGFPKEGAEETILPDPEPLPKTAKRKKDISPKSWQQSIGHWPQVQCSPHFCLAMFWGPPLTVELPAHARNNSQHALGRQKAKANSQDTNETNRKTIAVPGTERIGN